MSVLGIILVAGSVANLHSWAKVIASIFLSQRRQLSRAIKINEGAPLSALGAEVSLMTDMVSVIDIQLISLITQ